MKATLRVVVQPWLVAILSFIWLIVGCEKTSVPPKWDEVTPLKVGMQVSVQEMDDRICVEGVQSSGALFKLCLPTD